MLGTFHVFSGGIYKVGIIRFVDVPAGVSREIAGGAANVAVQGTVEGVPLRTTLVPRGQGCHRLAIHGEIRKKLRVDAGAVVEVALERDEESREPAVPPALADGLAAGPAGAGGVSRGDDGAAAGDCAICYGREAGGDEGTAGANDGAEDGGAGGEES